jgi:hypothetical protein
MQKKIKAKVITWLKSAPMPSQDLAPDALQFVPAGREYGVETIEDAPSGHWLVTLAARSGKRYVFADHWSVIEPPAARPQSPVVLRYVFADRWSVIEPPAARPQSPVVLRYVFADRWSVIEPPAARSQSPVVLLDKEFDAKKN